MPIQLSAENLEEMPINLLWKVQPFDPAEETRSQLAFKKRSLDVCFAEPSWKISAAQTSCWKWKEYEWDFIAALSRGDKADFSPITYFEVKGSSQLGYMASACFSTILQVISYSWCIGRETNQFPSTALSSDCQIFLISIYYSSRLGGAFPYSSLLTFYLFIYFCQNKMSESESLNKSGKVEHATLSPP